MINQKQIKISVITPCYNSEATILKNILSVKAQTYKNYEHIFIDGKSTDNTLEIIAKNAANHTIVSEEDEGIYNAMNKGIKLSSGDIVCILNSDDYYENSSVFENAALISSKHDNNKQIISFDVDFYNPKDGSYSTFHAHSSSLKSPLLYNQLPHPGLFIKTSSREELLFDESFKIVSDLHQQLKLFYKHNYIQVCVNETSTVMVIGGASSGSLKKYIYNSMEIVSVFNNIFKGKGFIFATIRLIKNILRRFKNLRTFFK